MIGKSPIGDWVESAVNFLTVHAEGFFEGLSTILEAVVNSFTWMFQLGPFWMLIAILTIIAFIVGRWSLALLTGIGLLMIVWLGYWEATILTLSLVLTSTVLSILIGVPLGILSGTINGVSKVLRPLMDFMQTMPAFVYLLPAVILFGLGIVPGIIASVIFAVPPTIRLTDLGIRQVPQDMTEAANSFGSTPWQRLWKVQLPIALPTLMAGVNQTIMLSLSMVVIASMIGAQGVGTEVYRAVTQLKIGQGFEAGLAVVLLAIILDRFSQRLIKSNHARH
ncbi:ABC transporter permease [Paenibacillus aquistagni]|uniref:Glycine betaine/proline transport system permease protein n=1 Tax=Paenibacillus aquistagni TaxID=1852522 RepID=A0A1X7K5F0_9BACL|nr:proline/glycine betaine ABC transporter permease [Paenibacillus aquistagni]SMG35991.1 glycine betaine/proline transport system permease protein [Paenibacillus aquistagni]